MNYVTLSSRVAMDIEQQEKKWEQEKEAKKQKRESGKVFPAAGDSNHAMASLTSSDSTK